MKAHQHSYKHVQFQFLEKNLWKKFFLVGVGGYIDIKKNIYFRFFGVVVPFWKRNDDKKKYVEKGFFHILFLKQDGVPNFLFRPPCFVRHHFAFNVGPTLFCHTLSHKFLLCSICVTFESCVIIIWWSCQPWALATWKTCARCSWRTIASSGCPTRSPMPARSRPSAWATIPCSIRPWT